MEKTSREICQLEASKRYYDRHQQQITSKKRQAYYRKCFSSKIELWDQFLSSIDEPTSQIEKYKLLTKLHKEFEKLEKIQKTLEDDDENKSTLYQVRLRFEEVIEIYE